ncbi:MAG: M28 family peptidase [Thermomicrobiales bacterium]
MSADINFDLLKRLCETPGIPGREEAVRAVVREAMDEIVDEIEVDAMGNLIGRRKGNGGPTVMFAGHMDEIGFMVKHIDDKGFLRLQPVGGFDGRVLPAQRCHVHTEAGAVLPGAMALETKPIHLLSGSDIQAPKVEQIFVDLGLSGDEVKEKVQIGDMVTMDRTVERIGDNVMGKAFDDRISIFLMLEAARLLGDEDVQSEIVLAATTQEEVGLRGARTAAYHVQPDIGVALDITLAMDIPGASPEDAVTRLGDGAAIKVFDSSHISNHKLVSHFKRSRRTTTSSTSWRSCPGAVRMPVRCSSPGPECRSSRSRCRLATFTRSMRWLPSATSRLRSTCWRRTCATPTKAITTWRSRVHGRCGTTLSACRPRPNRNRSRRDLYCISPGSIWLK